MVAHEAGILLAEADRLITVLEDRLVQEGEQYPCSACLHAAFAGAALGLLLPAVDPFWMALIFSLAAAATLEPLANLSRLGETDTAIDVLFPLIMALGLIFVHRASRGAAGAAGPAVE